MSILDIRVLGDPILREETAPVGPITDELRALARDMFETMHVARGIGLAAPQIGRTERLAVVEVDEHKLVIINPEVVYTEGKAKAEEGCLSIPDIYGDIERPENCGAVLPPPVPPSRQPKQILQGPHGRPGWKRPKFLRVMRSVVRSASLWGWPPKSSHEVSLNPMLSTTRVSPSHLPTE